MDYVKIASAMLAEVGLSFDDVYDLGRPWRRGPPGWEFMIGKPAYSGVCLMPSRYNPTSRQRHLIGLTGPVDSEWMLYILAHECGHVGDYRGGSCPEYEDEYRAEMWAISAFRRHLGRDPHDFLIGRAKKYVRQHCWRRFKSLGPEPTKGWRRDIIEWCGFPAPVVLR